MESDIIETLGVQVRFFSPIDTDGPEGDKLTYLDHSHSFFELHIIEAGEYHFTAENQRFSLKSGQFCLISPNVIHSPKPSEKAVQRLCINLEYLLPATALGRWLQAHSGEETVWVGSAEQMLPLAEEIREERMGGGAFSRATMEALLGLLVVKMARAMGIQEKSVSFQGQEDTRSLYIDQFLNNRFALAAGEEVLARELNLSRRQLDRIIQKQYGMSFRQKRSQIRFALACDLLRNSKETIAKISEELGYSTPSNFTVFFKEMHGMTPGEYREQFLTIENKT